MRSVLGVVLVMSAVGPVHAEHADVVGAKADAVLAGNVLVWVDARLYLDADEKGESIQLATLTRPRKDSIGHVMPMRVVGTSGTWIEVEPTTGSDCAWVKIEPDEVLARRWYIKRDDLAELVTKRYDAKLAGGTRITLDVGAAVGRSKDGSFHVAFRGDELPAAIPETSVGHAYKPYKVTAVKERGAIPLHPGEVKLGDRTVPVADRWRAARVARRGDLVLFPLNVACMSAIVAVPKARTEQTMEIHDARSSAKGRKGADGNGNYLPRGTALTSALGTHIVAITRRHIWISSHAGNAPVCIDRAVTLEETVDRSPSGNSSRPVEQSMHLCAPASALRHRHY